MGEKGGGETRKADACREFVYGKISLEKQTWHASSVESEKAWNSSFKKTQRSKLVLHRFSATKDELQFETRSLISHFLKIIIITVPDEDAEAFARFLSNTERGSFFFFAN